MRCLFDQYLRREPQQQAKNSRKIYWTSWQVDFFVLPHCCKPLANPSRNVLIHNRITRENFESLRFVRWPGWLNCFARRVPFAKGKPTQKI